MKPSRKNPPRSFNKTPNINDSIIRQREQEITKLAQGVLEVWIF